MGTCRRRTENPFTVIEASRGKIGKTCWYAIVCELWFRKTSEKSPSTCHERQALVVKVVAWVANTRFI
jgi:hypothetical protein